MSPLAKDSTTRSQEARRRMRRADASEAVRRMRAIVDGTDGLARDVAWNTVAQLLFSSNITPSNLRGLVSAFGPVAAGGDGPKE